jgi:hypothetical protein
MFDREDVVNLMRMLVDIYPMPAVYEINVIGVYLGDILERASKLSSKNAAPSNDTLLWFTA